MARPREFEMDTAIADAMNVFWTHGYEDSSLPQLLEGTGLSRGSLYKAFAGKQSLFIAALRRYAEQEVAPVGVMLSDAAAGDGITRIRAVFANIPVRVREGDMRGCLLCSAAAGRAAQEPEIAVVIHELLNAMKHGFAAALDTSDQDSEGLAHTLVGQYIGLRTLARAKTPADTLQASVDAMMRMLEHRAAAR